MKKKQEKMQDKDLFSISKGSRRGMVVFLVLMEFRTMYMS